MAPQAPANTVSSYQHQWSLFETWCASEGVTQLPAHPLTVLLYLHSRYDKSPSTLKLQRSAIRAAHIDAGHHEPPTDHPLVKNLIAAHAREQGTGPHPSRTSRPITLEELATLAAHAWENRETDSKALKLRAWMLLLFDTAWRHHHSQNTHRNDMIRTPEGIRLRARQTKTRQREGESRLIAHICNPKPSSRIVCPACALEDYVNSTSEREWKEGATAGDGPLFPANSGPWKRDSAVRALRKLAATAGVDPTRLGSHSFKKGHVTTRSVVAGESVPSIAADIGTTIDILYRHYIVVDDETPDPGHLHEDDGRGKDGARQTE